MVLAAAHHMKPLRLWMALNDDGSPRFGSSGYYLPLNKTANEARLGWGTGFYRPRVVEVEVRPMNKKKGKGGKRPKPYRGRAPDYTDRP